MKILFNRETEKYLPIVIDDTSDMDKVIDTFEEWLKDSANEKLLELDFTLMEGHYSLNEEWEGVLHLVELTDNDFVDARYYTTSYEFELRDLSTIKIK